MDSSIAGLALLVTLSGRSTPALALAQPAAAADRGLSWETMPECLDAATANAALDALLGEGWQTSMQAKVTVGLTKADEGFVLTVRTRTLQSREPLERSLTDPSCEALGEAGILVVALAVRPELELGPGDLELLDRLLDREGTPEPEPVCAPEPPLAPEPAPAPVCDPEPQSPAPPTRRITGALTLRAALGWGLLPRLESGPIAGGAIILPRARFEFDGRAWFGPVATVPGPGSVEVTAWAFGLRGGPAWTVGPVVLPLMFGTELGQLVARPEDLRNPRVQRPTWAALTATAGAAYSPIERLGLTAMLEGYVALSRPSLSVEGYDQPVHTPAEGGVRLLLGVEARFP